MLCVDLAGVWICGGNAGGGFCGSVMSDVIKVILEDE